MLNPRKGKGMRNESTLTWRTFRLSVVGLCLACTHAAMALNSPPSGGKSSIVTHKGSAQPANRGGATPRSNWVGVGPSTVATFTRDGKSGQSSIATHTRGSAGTVKVVSRSGATAAGARPAPATKSAMAAAPASGSLKGIATPAMLGDEREQAADQARRVDLSLNLRASMRVVTPDDPNRDPRIERALRPVASGPTIERNAFAAGAFTTYVGLPPK